jgi:LPS-assembly protein
MGRRRCPGDPIVQRDRAGPRAALVGARGFARLLALLLAVATALLAAADGAAAQTVNERLAQSGPGKPGEKMLVEADQLVYDSVHNTVSAQGNVRMYYGGRTLQADRVTYDRKTNRVYAEGNAQLTERDGSVSHGTRFELTEDFRNGFVDSLRVDTASRTHFSAPRVERIEGDTTVFERGTYSACDVCSSDPDKPPLWRIRAKRIIHKDTEQTIYYEDASIEFLGIPLAYVPFFSMPDPSVTRRSGILAPHFLYKSQLGAGVGIPIFWALAPDYDLTVTPTAFTKQGFFGAAQFRQRLENGYYYIRATGIDELDPHAFYPGPFGSADHRLRGSFETKGQVNITDEWKFGWEFTLLSDKWYLYDYSIPNQTLSSNYFSEATSTLYLTGKSEHAYFDLRGYYFEGLSSHDFQPQQPLVRPVWDYNRVFDIDPAKSYGVGGRATLDFNLTSLSASAASFQSVGPRTLDSAYNLYDVCSSYTPGRSNGNCLLRGIGGDYTRVTVDTSWQRKFIDPLGQVWTPFVFARVDGQTIDLNTSRSYAFSSANGMSSYSNASQTAFNNGVANGTYGNVIPGVGLEYRYPILAKTPIGSIVFEPIGQIIVRPNAQIGTNSLLNLDSQSLVFDDTTLFQWNKYSGYDRFETGTRANYGGQATLNFNNGGYVNVIAGQSYQVAGANSYATPDAANIGLSSGLDTRLSDYVGAFTIAPGGPINFTAKGRFDEATLEPRRVDLIASGNFGALTTNIQYANYQAQPVIGYDVRREGLALSGRYKMTANYFAQGNVTFDMSRHLYPPAIVGYTSPGLFFPAALGLGAGYTDECTTLSLNYSSIYQDNGSGTLVRNQTFLLELQLRTLGDAKFSQSITPASTIDGLK